jgi:hypothetical protein
VALAPAGMLAIVRLPTSTPSTLKRTATPEAPTRPTLRTVAVIVTSLSPRTFSGENVMSDGLTARSGAGPSHRRTSRPRVMSPMNT